MPTDTVPLDDNRLDLTADHVHKVDITVTQAEELLADNNIGTNFDEILSAAIDYQAAEEVDTVLVITIKKD